MVRGDGILWGDFELELYFSFCKGNSNLGGLI